MRQGANPEWDFLAADAARVGAQLPAVFSRFYFDTAAGQLAALRFSDDAAVDPPADFLLLHGAGLYAHSFDAVNLLLSGTRIAVDLPGHGASAWRADADYRPGTLAAQLRDPLQQFISERTTVVGHSLGGLTAALWAAAVPERVREVVLVDITPESVASGASAQVVEFITGRQRFESLTQMVDRAIEFGIGSDREVLTRGVTLNSRYNPAGYYEWAHHFAQLPGMRGVQSDPQHLAASCWEALLELQQRGVRLRLVAADQGFVSAAEIAQWRNRLPGSEVVTLTGPHNLHEAVPQQLARVLLETAGN